MPRGIFMRSGAVLLFACAHLGCAAATSLSPPPAPVVLSEADPGSPGPAADGPEQFFARGLFRAYQQWVSPSRGWICPMVPSCSAFGRTAVERRGLLPGIVLTADRLQRCGHDPYLYRVRTLEGRAGLDDPVP